MPEITTVNDLVLKHAEENKLTQDNGNQQQQTQVEKKDEGDAEPPEQQQAASEAKQEKDPVAELLKELNLDSIDSLKEKLKPKAEQKELSPEDKAKEDEKFKADLIRYAVDNGMKVEDFSKLDALKSKADKDLVFENWLSENKDDYEGLTDEQKAEQAKEDFEEEYKLNSGDEKKKAKALAKITKEAAAIRSPLESSYKKVEADYRNEVSIKQEYPNYAKKIDSIVSENVPTKFEVFKTKDGEEDVVVSVDITEKEQKEITKELSKRLQTPETYKLYKDGKFEEIKVMADKIKDNLLWEKKRDEGFNEMARTFTERGKKKAPIVGATNPFPIVKENAGAAAKKSGTDAEQEVLDSLNRRK